MGGRASSSPKPSAWFSTADRLLRTRVLTAVVVVAVLLAALLWLPPVLFRFLVGGVVLAAAHEWARLCGLVSVGAVAYAGALVVAWGGLLTVPSLHLPLLLLSAVFWAVAVPLWLRRGFLPGPRGVLLATGAIVLLPAGVAMASLQPVQLLVLIGLSAVADTAAYFAGRAWGRRKLAPAISPGKTWEGVAGGAAGCLIYATICAMLVPEFQGRIHGAGWVFLLSGAVLLCAASVLGDLLESALKRRAGAKDSGRLLPGHGGALDRIDSATAALPAGLLLLLAGGLA